MTDTNKLVSVILPVYNGERFVKEAVTSILNQTYPHLELIIIDDGSTDNSLAVIEQVKDERIRLYRQANCGLAATLNRALGLAGGEYIARQDGDDVAYPQRLEKQLHFLEKNKLHALVGTWAKIISDEDHSNRSHHHPADDLTLKFDLMFDNPFVHSSVMLRREHLECIGQYKTDKVFEDYDLWSRIARTFAVANIPETLQVYREVKSGISKTTVNYTERVIEQSLENIRFLLPGEQAAVQDLVYLYHGAFGKYRNTPPAVLHDMLILIADTLSVQNNADKALLRKRAQSYIIKLKRMYNAYRLQDARTGTLTKLFIKIRNKFSLAQGSR